MALQLTEAVFVDGHAHGGVHTDFFERCDLALRVDSACGDDRMRCGGAKFAKPIEICAGHGAFAVDVGAEEGATKRFELGHYVFGTKYETAPPAVDGDAAFCGVQGDDYSIRIYFI